MLKLLGLMQEDETPPKRGVFLVVIALGAFLFRRTITRVGDQEHSTGPTGEEAFVDAESFVAAAESRFGKIED